MITKQDYLIGALVGFLTGVFAVPTFVGLGINNWAILMLLPLVLAVVVAIGLMIGKFLSRLLPFIAQFSKFAAVGALNTMIDFGVLNILSIFTGVTAGLKVGGVNIPGFILAVINAYFWNKWWVFHSGEGKSATDFPKFVAVSIGGLILNTGIVILLTTPFSPPLGLSSHGWLNLAKAGATIISLIWNFVGYKFLVFRKAPQIDGETQIQHV